MHAQGNESKEAQRGAAKMFLSSIHPPERTCEPDQVQCSLLVLGCHPTLACRRQLCMQQTNLMILLLLTTHQVQVQSSARPQGPGHPYICVGSVANSLQNKTCRQGCAATNALHKPSDSISHCNRCAASNPNISSIDTAPIPCAHASTGLMNAEIPSTPIVQPISRTDPSLLQNMRDKFRVLIDLRSELVRFQSP